jgi:fructosamine-3-kinase
MSWEHPLLDPAVVAEIERAASEHRGRPWVSQGFTSLDERSSHPCGVLHGQPFSVFAKLSAATNTCGQFTAELAGLRLLSQAARVPTPVSRGLAELPHGWLLLTEALPERLPPDREARDWRSIGQVLATLHRVKHRQFGLDRGGYFSHPEMDLAMVDFFQPVPADVLDGYRDTATIASGFADRKELWRLYAYLAVVTVDRQYLTRLADAIRRYR